MFLGSFEGGSVGLVTTCREFLGFGSVSGFIRVFKLNFVFLAFPPTLFRLDALCFLDPQGEKTGRRVFLGSFEGGSVGLVTTFRGSF